MKPIEFEGQNVVYAKDQPQYEPLPAWRDKVQSISCWQLTPEELKEVKRTGVIWVSQLNYGAPLQPQRIDVYQPLAIMLGNVNVLDATTLKLKENI